MQKQDKNAADKFAASLHRLAQKQYNLFLEGLMRYRASPQMRNLRDVKTVWQKGTTRILDYSRQTRSGDVPLVLVIPSLINRYHVLDLDAQQSFMRALAEKGFAPWLVDWGVPGREEKAYSLDDYVAKRLIPALDAAVAKAGGKVHVVGYCMGGLFAAALAAQQQAKMRSLLFLATPWDFHADQVQLDRVQDLLPRIREVIAQQGELPVDVLQCYFISLQPFILLEKFLRLATLAQGSAGERAFVLIEDWVNEGVPLAGKVALQCLEGWYVQNAPHLGVWQVMGKPVRPEDIRVPSLHVIPQNDKIVPPQSALALARSMRRATILQPEFGHISMLVHAAARDKLWPRLFDWLASH